MKQISFWAACHPRTTWALLAIMHTGLGILAFESGVLLAVRGVSLPPLLLGLGIGVCLLATLFYPMRRIKSPWWKWSYARQKSMDLALVLSGIVMMMTWSNAEAIRLNADPETGRAMTVALHDRPGPPSGVPFWQMVLTDGPVKATQQVLRKEVSKRVRANLEENGYHNPWWIFVIMGIGILASILLACAASCGGANAWGLVILFGGVLVFALACTYWYRTEKRKRLRKAGMEMG